LILSEKQCHRELAPDKPVLSCLDSWPIPRWAREGGEGKRAGLKCEALVNTNSGLATCSRQSERTRTSTHKDPRGNREPTQRPKRKTRESQASQGAPRGKRRVSDNCHRTSLQKVLGPGKSFGRQEPPSLQPLEVGGSWHSKKCGHPLLSLLFCSEALTGEPPSSKKVFLLPTFR
jgi:hypothetical protein